MVKRHDVDVRRPVRRKVPAGRGRRSGSERVARAAARPRVGSAARSRTIRVAAAASRRPALVEYPRRWSRRGASSGDGRKKRGRPFDAADSPRHRRGVAAASPRRCRATATARPLWNDGTRLPESSHAFEANRRPIVARARPLRGASRDGFPVAKAVVCHAAAVRARSARLDDFWWLFVA